MHSNSLLSIHSGFIDAAKQAAGHRTQNNAASGSNVPLLEREEESGAGQVPGPDGAIPFEVFRGNVLEKVISYGYG